MILSDVAFIYLIDKIEILKYMVFYKIIMKIITFDILRK